MIQEEEAIVIGSRSTMLALVKAIPENFKLTVLTVALDVAITLMDYQNIEIVQLGGVVRGKAALQLWDIMLKTCW